MPTLAIFQLFYLVIKDYNNFKYMICQLKIVLDNETGPNITKFGYYHNAFGLADWSAINLQIWPLLLKVEISYLH
jgi:hypothetical protein